MLNRIIEQSGHRPLPAHIVPGVRFSNCPMPTTHKTTTTITTTTLTRSTRTMTATTTTKDDTFKVQWYIRVMASGSWMGSWHLSNDVHSLLAATRQEIEYKMSRGGASQSGRIVFHFCILIQNNGSAHYLLGPESVRPERACSCGRQRVTHCIYLYIYIYVYIYVYIYIYMSG